MTDYTKYLESFLLKINVPYVSRENILHIYDCITITEEKRQRISDIISQYKDTDFDFKKVLKDFEDFALPRLRNKCEVDLLCICLLTKQLEVLYNNNNISCEIFLDSVSDFRNKIHECENVEKLSGIFCAEFYEDMFRLKLFKLGRLQFQLKANVYGIPRLKANDSIIAIHIPNTGEKLEPKEVDKSIQMAKAFFKERFGITDPVFTCASWLLFNENRNMLDKESNIVKFADRFEIIKTIYFDDYFELWRIFDRNFNGLRSLKEDTTLRRGYKKLVAENKPIGEAIGYFRG